MSRDKKTKRDRIIVNILVLVLLVAAFLMEN
jgi:hypothetical protein